jgi:hypothetical protein
MYRAEAPAHWIPSLIAIFVVVNGIQIGGVIVNPPPATARWVGVVIAIAAIDTAIVALMVRSYRAAVFTDRDGVTVKNVWRKYRVQWNDVEGFALGETAYQSCIGFLNRRSGKSIPLYGVRGARGWLLDQSAEAARLVAVLNEELALRRAEQ